MQPVCPIHFVIQMKAILLGTVLLMPVQLLADSDRDDDDDHHDDRPNIIVFMSDDQGSFDFGYQGSRIRTPNIDSIAEEGVQLERFYVQPYCVPTRASFMTGDKLKSWAFRGEPAGDESIPPDTPTIARRFQDAGYQTALIGKWHLGTNPRSHPNEMGFDHFYGFLGCCVDYFTKIEALTREHDWQRNGTPVFEDGYQTTQLADETIKLIEQRDPNRPFFTVVTFGAPHGPISAPPKAIEKSCSGGTAPYNCVYLAAIEVMDTEVGRVLNALEEQHLTKDTIVMFFTDNGGCGKYGSYNVPPLRGCKISVYEGAIRVGAVIKWPGKLKPSKISQPMHVRDLWATFEGAAKLPREASPESVNHWKTLRKAEHSEWHDKWKRRWRHDKPERSLFFTNRPDPCMWCCCYLFFSPWNRQAAVIQGDWKLILNEKVTLLALPWREIVLPDRSVELYNLRSDPGETTDLSQEKPQRTERMLEELRRWEESRE